MQCLEEEEVKHESLLDSNPMVIKLFNEALYEVCQKDPVRRKRSRNNVAVLASHENEFWLYNSDSSLSELCTIPKQQEDYMFSSFCPTPEGFAITGGYDIANERQGNEAVMFHMKSKKWEKLTNLPVRRHGHGSLFIKNCLFVFGGEVDGSETKSKSVEYLDDKGSWHSAGDMPEGVWFMQIAATDDHVFILDADDTNKLFMMNIQTDVWSIRTSPPVNTSGARMICINEDKLCVAGGVDNILAFYTPSTDTWELGPKPQLRHSFGAVVNHGNKIDILGGGQSGDQLKIETFDMEKKVWTVSEQDMSVNVNNMHCFKVST